jgi:hypothetical protein
MVTLFIASAQPRFQVSHVGETVGWVVLGLALLAILVAFVVWATGTAFGGRLAGVARGKGQSASTAGSASGPPSDRP